MFYIGEIRDRIRISLTSEDKEQEVARRLREKYVGGVLEDSSICILLIRVVRIYDYRVSDEFLIAKVRFEMLFFKFLRYEVIFGRVLEQNDDGMKLGIPFADGLDVKKNNLPVVSEKVYVSDGKERQLSWVWIYKDNRLYFRKDEDVRFRVEDIREQPLEVMCNLNEVGLGPLSWWM